MARCILVGAAKFDSEIEICPSDYIIAADGGYANLCKRNIAPNLLIGDFDSIEGELPSGIERISYPIEKDDTDMRLAYLEGRKRGYTDFIILGGAGGRIDHTLANFSLMLEIAENGGAALLIADDFEARLIDSGELYLPEKENGTVSVFAVGGDAEGVSIEGLKYSARNITLKESYALGVSNSFIGTEAKISVRHGKILAIIGKGY